MADTVAVVIQPGSGDVLQFLKAGIMEVPDVLVVTKADLGRIATRTVADLQAALRSLGEQETAVVAVSSVPPSVGRRGTRGGTRSAPGKPRPALPPVAGAEDARARRLCGGARGAGAAGTRRPARGREMAVRAGPWARCPGADPRPRRTPRLTRFSQNRGRAHRHRDHGRLVRDSRCAGRPARRDQSRHGVGVRADRFRDRDGIRDPPATVTTRRVSRIVLPAEPLFDERTALRPWRDTDIGPLVAACQDPEISRWTSVPNPYGESDARAYLLQRFDAIHAGTAAPFAVVDSADGGCSARLRSTGSTGRTGEPRSDTGWRSTPAATDTRPALSI